MDIQQLKLLKILVIGDSCKDVYHFGEVKRISPEAPVPIFDLVYSKSHPGMAANVKANLEALGVSVDFVTNPEKNFKERYIDVVTRQHMIRVDRHGDGTVEPCNYKKISGLQKYDAILISDYDKGFISEPGIEFLIERFDKPIFVDSKKSDLSAFRGCIIKINEKERRMIDHLPKNCEVIVTLGSRGAEWKQNIYPAKEVEIYDVCGAGDTFFSALACAYLLTKDMEKAIKFANKCANISVQRLGTYAPTVEEML